jgi:hypothetical protein
MLLMFKVSIKFIFGFILLFQQFPVCSASAGVIEIHAFPQDPRLGVLKVNGLDIVGTPALLEKLGKKTISQSTWVDQLVRDKNAAQSVKVGSNDDSDCGSSEVRQDCPICFEDLYKQKKLIASECGHLFCEKCFDSLQMGHEERVCPLCRDEDWNKDVMRLEYVQDVSGAYFVKVIPRNFVANFIAVGAKSKLGTGLMDPSDVTWYKAARKKVRIGYCPLSPQVETDELRIMDFEKAQAYCRKRYASLPRRSEFRALRAFMGYPFFQTQFDETPELSSVRQNSFWTSESFAGSFDDAHLFDGVEGEIKSANKKLKLPVMCIQR